MCARTLSNTYRHRSVCNYACVYVSTRGGMHAFTCEGIHVRYILTMHLWCSMSQTTSAGRRSSLPHVPSTPSNVLRSTPFFVSKCFLRPLLPPQYSLTDNAMPDCQPHQVAAPSMAQRNSCTCRAPHHIHKAHHSNPREVHIAACVAIMAAVPGAS